MKSNIRNKAEKKFPEREGSEDSSILGKEDAGHKKKYPWPEEKDKQVKNQPAFIEPQDNKKTK